MSFDSDTPEIWVPVPQAPNYEISNHGRVRPVVDITRGRPGFAVASRPAGVPLVPRPPSGTRRYPYVSLRYAGRNHEIAICRAVWKAFRDPLSHGESIKFIDGDVDNAAISNLRVTAHAQGVVNRDVVRRLREAYTNGVPVNEIARNLGLTTSTVSSVARGKGWKHLPVLPARCLICGNDITRKTNGQKRYCGKQCFDVAQRLASRKRNGVTKPHTDLYGVACRTMRSELGSLIEGYSPRELAVATGLCIDTARKLLRGGPRRVHSHTYEVLMALEQKGAAGD